LQRASPTRRVAFILVLLVGAVLLASNQVHAQESTQITGIGPWTEQIDYGASTGNTGSGGVSILGESCVTYSSYIYCVGGQNIKNVTSPNTSDVFYAPVSPSGTVGAWTETTDYGATSGMSGNGGFGVGWPSCVQYSGYIYCFGGSASSGVVSRVYYAQLSSSGVGPWTETTDYGASSGTSGSGGVPAFQLSCVVDSGYVYCVGSGFNTSQVFYAQLSPGGVGHWIETTDYGASSGKMGLGGIAIGSAACADSSGYIWCVGGTISGKPVSDVFYAPVNASGVGAWTETTDYGATSGSSGTGGIPVYGSSCVSWAGYIICVAGDTTGGSPINTVAYAKDPTGDPVELVWVVPPNGYIWEGYWNFCEVSGSPTSAFAICYGGGASHGASAPMQTSSSPTSTTTTTILPPTSSLSSYSSSSSSSPSSSVSSSSSVTSSIATVTSISTPSSTSTSSTSGSFPLLTVAVIAIVLIALLVTGTVVLRTRKGRRQDKEEGKTKEKPPPPPPPPPPSPPSTTSVAATDTTGCEGKSCVANKTQLENPNLINPFLKTVMSKKIAGYQETVRNPSSDLTVSLVSGPDVDSGKKAAGTEVFSERTYEMAVVEIRDMVRKSTRWTDTCPNGCKCVVDPKDWKKIATNRVKTDPFNIVVSVTIMVDGNVTGKGENTYKVVTTVDKVTYQANGKCASSPKSSGGTGGATTGKKPPGHTPQGWSQWEDDPNHIHNDATPGTGSEGAQDAFWDGTSGEWLDSNTGQPIGAK
jgi:hypothetical protein